MTLIELIIYIGFLFIIMTSSVFSAYSIMLSQQKAQNGWDSIGQQLRD